MNVQASGTYMPERSGLLLLPGSGKRRFDLPLLLLALFGRRSLALTDQFVDVTFEILLTRVTNSVFVLFHMLRIMHFKPLCCK